MSAWYVLSAMGMYPVCPGIGNVFEKGVPLFESVQVTDNTRRSFSLPAKDGDITPITFRSHTDDAPAEVTVVPAPFIATATKVFALSQQIDIHCLDKDADI